MKWNDPDFFFDHDFKPTNPQGRGEPLDNHGDGRGESGTKSFFNDFSGFYQSNQRVVEPDGQTQGPRSFGTDGFPNYFEGDENPRRQQQVDSNVAFETFADENQRPNRSNGAPPGLSGNFRHHRGGPIKIPNRRVLKILRSLKKQLPPTNVKI